MAANSTPEEEVRRLERHYSVNPEGLVFARLADAYRRCGRLERSLKLLREGLERHPDYTTGHLIEGRTLREAGRPEEAAESFRRVLQLDAGNLVALRSLAELAAERGDMAEAHRWADRLEQADPYTSFNPAEVAARARGARERGGKKEAKEERGENPGRGEAAEPAVREGRVRSAEEGDDSEPPASGPAEVEAGVPTELPGEDGLASEIAAMADEQWWSSAEEGPSPDAGDGGDPDVATETMAHLYAQQGLYEEAADVYRRLLERRPDDEQLRRRLEEMTRRADGRAQAEQEEQGTEDGAAPTGEPPPEEHGRRQGEPSHVAGSDPEVPAPVSAREHFRALLRGRAGSASTGEDGDPDAARDEADDVGPGDRRDAVGEAAG